MRNIMYKFSNIFYILGVICSIIGFILYNYGVSNDRQILTAALLIGVGVAFLLGSYM